jgi:pimeloyl-ACP methyl ester carboxylesterase
MRISRRRFLTYISAGVGLTVSAVVGTHFITTRTRGTPEGLAIYLDAYDDTLELWPIPYEELDIITRFGTTHIIVSGPRDAPPLVLLHPNSTSSTVWFPNIADWSQNYRTYAIDIIGEPGKSVVTNLPKNRIECAKWLEALFDKLEIEKAPIIGGSYGGFHTTNFAIKKPERVKKIALLAANGFTGFNSRFGLLALGSYFFPVNFIIDPFFREFVYKEPNEIFFKQLIFAIKYFDTKIALTVPPTVFSDEELQSLKTPLLYLLGDKEVIYDDLKIVIERVQQLVPNGKAEIIPEAGHLLAHDQPEIINNRIMDFIEE